MRYLLLIMLIFISCGCCLVKGRTKPAGPGVSAPTLPEEEPFSKNIKILNEEQFRKGGKILVVPFTPDVNAAAGEQLDRVSLMIVKSIADSLGASSRFSVLDADNAATADLILQGRIMAMKQAGRLKRLATFKDKKSIMVEGNLVDAKSGQIVFHFSDAKTSRDKTQTFVDLGSSIGRDIGEFLKSSQN